MKPSPSMAAHVALAKLLREIDPVSENVGACVAGNGMVAKLTITPDIEPAGKLTPTERVVLEILYRIARPMTAKAIAEEIERTGEPASADYLRQLMPQLRHEGYIKKVRGGFVIDRQNL